MIVDALGNPLAFTLTAGQVHDITQAETLTSQVQPEALLADKGYDADAYIASLRARAVQPVILPRRIAKTNAIATCIVPRAQSSRNASSNSSSNSVASPPVTKKPRAISRRGCSWCARWLAKMRTRASG